jgi:hypothetical protein
VAQLLAKTPAARPTDAAELKARLVGLPLDPTTAFIPRSARALAAVPRSALPAANRLARPTSVARSRGPNRRTLRLAVAGLVIALAAIMISWVATSRSAPSGAADPRATLVPDPEAWTAPSAAALPQSEPVTQPMTSAESSRPVQPAGAVQPGSPAPPVDPIVALRLSIQHQVNTGNLNPDKASDLYKKVDEIARAMNDGNTDEAAKKVKELRDRLVTLRNEGQLSGGGYDTLIRHLDSVAATLP